jgi:hypothetical protein
MEIYEDQEGQMAAETDIGGMMAGVAIMLAIAGFMFWQATAASKTAADPEDTSASEVGDLGKKTHLVGGPRTITFLRQSGGVYRMDFAATKAEAIAKVQSAFRRAGINVVRLPKNHQDGFKATRVMHDHRGHAEGKKLGGAMVERMSRATPSV